MTIFAPDMRPPRRPADGPDEQDEPATTDAAHPAEGLVHAARRGDRAAFAQLHERYAPMVHAILLAAAPLGECEDLMQEVFLKALRRLGGLREPAAFGPWLAAMTRRLAAESHRRRRRARAAGADLVARAAPGHSLAEREEAARVLSAIRELPEAYRSPLLMRLVEGLSGPRIAELSGLTHGSVRLNLHRGMRLLRMRLESPLPGGARDD